MQVVSNDIELQQPIAGKKEKTLCYHCGTPCITQRIRVDDMYFCCEGCKLIYELLNENGLCDYYKLESHPGLSQIKATRSEKHAYLEDEKIASKLYQFTDGDHTIVKLYVPGIHCSSCLWLLEHLHHVNNSITQSRVNFTAKELTVQFRKSEVTLREIVDLLTTIGYEPYISFDDADAKGVTKYNKQKIYKLGIAGFCFGNIMMMSFPEYLSFTGIEQQYVHLFRYLNLALALPVFFYSASEFFITAWKGIQQKTLNIDAPIALAIIITFTRSVYEIIANTGSGYLDSMSGIVFFMLVGRVVQERTYKSISFNRDYKSYFPIAVKVVTDTGTESRMLSELKEKDIVLLYSGEIIPADSIVTDGEAYIDYSFVTGESMPVTVNKNEMVYAGGKQVGAQIAIQVIKPVAGSYLTSLWSHNAFSQNKEATNDKKSLIHSLSKYFTWILLSLVVCTAAYWSKHDPTKIITSVTAMLIVACPCALLLSATFTNGNLLRILSDNGLFLRNATVIEQVGDIDHVVFDKTGTLTQNAESSYGISGHQLSEEEKDMVYSAVRSSRHPHSLAIAAMLGNRTTLSVSAWKELPGKGIECIIGMDRILVGSGSFTGVSKNTFLPGGTTVYVRINDKISSFSFAPVFRAAVPAILHKLSDHYKLSLLSGDNSRQERLIEPLFPADSTLLFEQTPMNKLLYIESLQKKGEHVMMVGDGLNDAGALQQSNVGITLADDINNFTPSCDAILEARKIGRLPSMLKLAVAGRYIITLSFTISIAYNIVGLYFAMQGMLKPMVAAILMPCSTLSIVLITTGMSSLIARALGLSLTAAE